MHSTEAQSGRRTATDEVYATLHKEIVSLKILPGTKLSETDVARRFGLSRQPVRKAFTRLGNQDLLVIRPQRATKVRSFSIARISHARFVRLAVELEVVSRAFKMKTDAFRDALASNIALQEKALAANDLNDFHVRDYGFHKLICELGGTPMAFDTILACKQESEQLCMLSIGHDHEAESILRDHQDIAEALTSGTLDQTIERVRHHLSRLNRTIEYIHQTYPGYFD